MNTVKNLQLIYNVAEITKNLKIRENSLHLKIRDFSWSYVLFKDVISQLVNL